MLYWYNKEKQPIFDRDPEWADVKLAQAKYLLSRLVEFKRLVSDRFNCTSTSLIVAGDFNSTPGDKVLLHGLPSHFYLRNKNKALLICQQGTLAVRLILSEDWDVHHVCCCDDSLKILCATGLSVPLFGQCILFLGVRDSGRSFKRCSC